MSESETDVSEDSFSNPSKEQLCETNNNDIQLEENNNILTDKHIKGINMSFSTENNIHKLEKDAVIVCGPNTSYISTLKLTSDDLKRQTNLNLDGKKKTNKPVHLPINRNHTFNNACLAQDDDNKDLYSALDDKNYIGCPTPDLLLKNYNLLKESKLQTENCPDLLRISFANPPFQSDNNSQDLSFSKYDNEVGALPVDIIGDFEQEVEREFGLLVNGYNRLIDASFADNDTKHRPILVPTKVVDAALSDGIEYICEDNLGNSFKKYYTKDKNAEFLKDCLLEKTQSVKIRPKYIIIPHEIKPYIMRSSRNVKISSETENYVQLQQQKDNLQPPDAVVLNTNSDLRYKKKSYDDRQLPIVGIDYKCTPAKVRTSCKSNNSHIKRKGFRPDATNSKTPYNKQFPKNASANENQNKMQEEYEVLQYQQLIRTDKELILSKSRYSKMSLWAQYLKNSPNKGEGEELTRFQKNQFSYICKINAQNMDISALEKHIKTSEKFEKKRQLDRDEIRRRLAMGAEDDYFHKFLTYNRSDQRSMQNALPLILMKEMSSDNESLSSDSETCPKLSKVAQRKVSFHSDIIDVGSEQSKDTNFSTNCAQVKNLAASGQMHLNTKYTEHDFFTKQARLQIEARMALAQAKDMAHIGMKVNQKKKCSFAITNVIRGSLEKVGIQMPSSKRRLSRQMLTDMNIAQLQIIFNDLHTNIQYFNDVLVHYLMERDELHMGQDSRLIDIEDITYYLGVKEQILQNNSI